MAIVVLVLCLLPLTLGAVGVASPARLRAIVQRLATPVGLYVGAGFRVALGIALLGVHPTTRAPEILRVVGVLMIAGGLTIPLLGLARLRGMVEWFLECAPAFVRGWGVLAVAFSLLLAYAVGTPPLGPHP